MVNRPLSLPNKRAHLGRRAEQKAVSLLSSLGYRIVDKNYRTRQGEIDLVAWEQETLCFVEVRARTHERFGPPAATVGLLKQKRIIQTAQHYLQTYHVGGVPLCRFDVLTFTIATGNYALFRNAFSVPSSL